MNTTGKNNVLLFFLVLTLVMTSFLQAQGETESDAVNEGMEVDPVKKRMNDRLDTDAFRVIEQKGTERAFTGEYWDNHEDGIYVCRRCGEPLYDSVTKFDSGCGWPSFDDEIDDAVIRKVDADGSRTEIICASCGGHLGHVFNGEGFTAKDTRHCVNSLSMRFVPASGETGRAVFAGGCFWGVEHFFNGVEGVSETTVGYTGGSKTFPTYKEVSYTDTGHLEAIEVLYDPAVVSFRELAMLFFEIHDPTQTDGQGPDLGGQYLSAVFYENKEQRKTAEELISILEEKGYNIATSLHQAAAFWPAEDYHQDYYSSNGKTPYCHAYTKRF